MDFMFSSELRSDFKNFWGDRSWAHYLKYSNYGIPDVLYFGDSNCSDVWSSLHDNADMVLRDNVDMTFTPEVILRQVLENNKININTMVNIDVDLLRNGQRHHG